MGFAEDLQKPEGVPVNYPLKSGCLFTFGFGIFFSAIFAVSVIIGPTPSGIKVLIMMVAGTVASWWIKRSIKKTIKFDSEGLIVTTWFFERKTEERVLSKDIALVRGVGESLGGRVARVRYRIEVEAKSGKIFKPEFKEFDFEEINTNIESLANLMGVEWYSCKEYVFDPN